jgi:signal transduction histidine kinase
VLRHPSSLEDARNRCVELIEANSRRMATITTRLLTLSSMEVNSLQTQEIELMSIASDVVTQLTEMAEKRGVSLRLDVPPVRMVTDVARVELILVNLISNAIKYCDPAKSERWAEIAAQELGNDVRLSVRDNGLGIPKEHIARVFDGFYRAHAARDHELDTDGLGLGLAIVAECGRHIGANVSIESDEGQGTTVNVSIPLFCGVTVIDDSHGSEPDTATVTPRSPST